MATTSEVKHGLDTAAQLIAGSTSQHNGAKAAITAARNQLQNLATQLSDVISTINGYTPTGAFESLAVDELSKLATEYQLLKALLEAHLIAIGAVAAADYTILSAADKARIVTALNAVDTVVGDAITTLS